MFIILFITITYLVSSIPFGLVISKLFFAKDIRNYGSGNIGATNMTRILGKKVGAVTFLLDGLKGAVFVVLSYYYFPDNKLLPIVIGIFAVIGHAYSIYLGFTGGKAVSTTMFVIFTINPLIGIFNASSWLLCFLITKTSYISSLSSIVATLLFSILYNVIIEEKLFYLFLVLLIILKHVPNLKNLRK